MKTRSVSLCWGFLLTLCCAAQEPQIKGLKVDISRDAAGVRLHFQNVSTKMVTAWSVIVMNTRQSSGRPLNRTVHAEDSAISSANPSIPPQGEWTSPLYPRPEADEAISQSAFVGAVIYTDGTVEGQTEWQTALVTRRVAGRRALREILRALSDPQVSPWTPQQIEARLEPLKSKPPLVGDRQAELAFSAFMRELMRSPVNSSPGGYGVTERLESLRSQLARWESYKP